MQFGANPRPEWYAVERDGCEGVQARLLMQGPGLVAIMLRFAPHATIDLHAAPHAIDVVCIEGAGFVRVGHETAPFADGQSVRWPMGVPHQLWTAGTPMTTLMLEHVAAHGSGL